MEAVPDWEDKVKEETDARQRLEAAETTLGTLHAKEGRKNQFKTQKERDAHLKSMIAKHAQSIKDREEGEQGLVKELESAKTDLEEVQNKAGEMRRELDGRKETLANLQAELNKLKEEHSVALEKRK